MKIRRNGLFALITLLFLFVIFVSPTLGYSANVLKINAPVRTLDLAPPSTSTITCSLSSSSLKLGDSITVNAVISPAVSGAVVTVYYIGPNGANVTRTTMAGSNSGLYTDNYTPNVAGDWIVTASWPGSDTYFGATSSTVPFKVQSSSGASGFSSLYIYLIVVVIIVVILAAAIYLYRKKK